MKTISLLLVLLTASVSFSAYGSGNLEQANINDVVTKARALRRANAASIENITNINVDLNQQDAVTLSFHAARIGTVAALLVPTIFLSRSLLPAYYANPYSWQHLRGILGGLTLEAASVAAPHLLYAELPAQAMNADLDKEFDRLNDGTFTQATMKERDLSLRSGSTEKQYLFISGTDSQKTAYIQKLVSQLAALAALQTQARQNLEAKISAMLSENDPHNKKYFLRVLSLGTDQIKFKNLVVIGNLTRIQMYSYFNSLSEQIEAELLAAKKLESQ